MKGVPRLINDFEPDNYDLQLKLDADKLAFEGKVKISGKKRGKPAKRLMFHQKNLVIKSARVTLIDKKGVEKEIELSRINLLQKANELRLHSKDIIYPGSYQVEIEFAGQINSQMHGIYCSIDRRGGKEYKIIATQFESHHAREAFPCIDEPEAKATFALTLTTNKNQTVLSNTPLQNQSSSRMMISRFDPTPKMSSYLLAFVVGELSFKENISQNGVKVRCYATPSNAKLLDYSIDIAKRAIDFFEKYFSTAYPLPKLDLVGLPDFSAGAMENWGLITFRESCLLVDGNKSNQDSKQFAALIICHEIAHQWFGNLVTMRWWDDLWLNESFANFMEYRAVDELFPEWKIWEHFVNQETVSAMRRDVLPDVQPVKLHVNHPDEINSLFDPSIVYAKGSVLLRMLVSFIGEDNFRKGLSQYFKVHAYGNTTGADLWAALAKSSGVDLVDFMTKWLTQPGVPVVEVDLKNTGAINFSQSRLTTQESLKYQSLWPIPLFINRETESRLMADKDLEITCPSIEKPFYINHDSQSYFVSNYLNESHFQKIIASSGKKELSTINRLNLIRNYVLLEQTMKVPTVKNMEILKSFKDEDDFSVWEAMAAILASSRRLVFSTPAEAIHKKFAAKLVGPLVDRYGWESSGAESSQVKKLRQLSLGLAASAEMPEIINEGLKRFDSFKQPSQLEPDIRSVVYYCGARFGSKDEFSKLLALYQTDLSAEEKEEICCALTVVRDEPKILRLLEFINQPTVRLQDTATWFAYLIANPYSRNLAWLWLKDNFDSLRVRYGGDPTLERYPRYAAAGFMHTSDLSDYKNFFNGLADDVRYSRTIKLGIQDIEARIAWREANQQPIIDWLNSMAKASKL